MNVGRFATNLSLFFIIFVPGIGTAADDDLAKKITEIIDKPKYKQARWGFLVVDAKSGKTLFERDSERLFTPASTTKLFSCATALATLGPDYRFVTPVHRRGEVKDGVLHGDLIIVASGDLTFGGRIGKDGKTLFANIDHSYANAGQAEAEITASDPLQALDDLARQIAKRGIKEVSGEILVDDRLFNRARGTGSGPDTLSPMVVNDNMLDITVTPGKQRGDLATVRIRPQTAYYQVDAEVRTVAADQPTQILIHHDANTALTIRGEIAVNAKPALRGFFVDEPVLFARALFIEALRRQNIRVTASLHHLGRFDLLSREDCAALPIIAEHTSAPFAETIAVTLKVSQNLYASTLPLLVAAKYGERNLDHGLRRQAAFLKELGVPVDTISFGGGAGGDNADAVTPAATVKLLQAMAKRPEADAFFNGLPVLGVDGTLADVIDPESPAKGKVRAKTGTLVWYDRLNDRALLRSKALAGTMETAKGSKLYIAIFLNDMPLPPAILPSREGKTIGKICEAIYQNGP
jgi:D-alanyl-D-alanine carboxypeptidase/D-alanyl-D-alanine-endopeptidase (penicillin-binding protein 4)